MPIKSSETSFLASVLNSETSAGAIAFHVEPSFSSCAGSTARRFARRRVSVSIPTRSSQSHDPVSSGVSAEIQESLSNFRVIVAFNRLEARPRTLDFTRSLRAEVRDPLWMLTRQWQFGEFAGEDAASCVTSRIAFQHETIDRVAFRGEKAFPFDPQTIPLETKVERERIPLTVRETGAEVFSDVLFAVQLGKQFLRLLQAAVPDLSPHYKLYLKKFPLRILPEPVAGKPRTVQDADAEQIQKSVGAHIADGVGIWRAVENGTHDPWINSEPTADPALKTIAATFAADCSRKFQRLFTQPDNATDSAWLQNHLEYQFSVAGQSGPNETQTVLLAEQYHQGRLDWHSFDIVKDRPVVFDGEPAPVAREEQLESFLPAHVRFKGQPQPRFWEMEETETDFGKIETSATGLLHLLLAEFGLIYSTTGLCCRTPWTSTPSAKSAASWWTIHSGGILSFVRPAVGRKPRGSGGRCFISLKKTSCGPPRIAFISSPQWAKFWKAHRWSASISSVMKWQTWSGEWRASFLRKQDKA